jgi:hypothetical protein
MGIGYIKAAEQASIDQRLANKVIIHNISGYPIEIKASDPRFSYRMANDSYQPIGNLSVQEVVERKLEITEFGHSGQWQAKGELKGQIPLYQLIEKARASQEKGMAFIVMILPPAAYGLSRQYSDWTKSYNPYFTYPSYAVGKQELPKSGDPYDIQEFKGIKDLISTYPGAVLRGYYPSIEALKEKDPVRWARLVFNLTKDKDIPQDVLKKAAESHYHMLWLKYHPDKNHQATPAEKELLSKIISIITEALSIIKKS